jgi:RNA polymerase sigma-70 factor, ECF subfamily
VSCGVISCSGPRSGPPCVAAIPRFANHLKHLCLLPKKRCGLGTQNAFDANRMNSRRKEASDDGSHVTNTESDARQALARGDRATVLTILARGYGDRILNYCLSILRNKSEAEDVAQEVFVNAFQYMDTFEGDKQFFAWLRGIATHRCIDALRKNGRWHQRFVVGKPLPDEPDPSQPADELLTYEELKDEVDRCIDRAPPRSRIYLVLRFRQSLSYAEMADILGEPATRLQARVSRQMRLLRLCLASRGIRP